MWNKLPNLLRKYPSAVLTGIDAEGYPYSLRCTPQVDAERQVLRLSLPDFVNLQAGPASILCHYHDEKLWNQTNLMLRGRLEQAGSEWQFTPSQFIEGAGSGMDALRQIQTGRRAAKEYLVKRSLQRPRIPWTKLKALYDRAQKG